MELPKVNLLEGETPATRKRRRAAAKAKHIISPLTLAIIFAASFLLGRVSLTEAASFAMAELQNVPILGSMSHLISSPDRKLAGETEDRINILLIGMGGEGHDGPYLTDTLIIGSIRPSDGSVAMLSIPRDLLVPVPDYGWRKINSVNAFGELANDGRGGELTRTTVEGLLGIDVPYYIRIDFEGFKSVIDDVDGIDVYVERDFTDYSYPTYEHGIQIVSFEEGWQHMTGETALQFARSRHGNNGEGSDFARSDRQQKVISALKQKMTDYKTYLNPAKITNTLASLQSNVATNINLGEMLRFARLAREIETSNVMHEVLDNGIDGPLVDSVVNGAYVLLPENGDWNVLRDVAVNLFNVAERTKPDELIPPAPDVIGATIEIQNGNGTSGIAREMSGKLSKMGFKVIKIGNADSFDYVRTLMFDLTDGKNKNSLDRLQQALPEAAIHDSRRAEKHSPTEDADFLIIIGQQ
ncbi:MAG: LCP family protein [Patescibacteria group bacterium]|nr:LCP family protein [Patescibacteria group bacterium]